MSEPDRSSTPKSSSQSSPPEGTTTDADPRPSGTQANGGPADVADRASAAVGGAPGRQSTDATPSADPTETARVQAGAASWPGGSSTTGAESDDRPIRARPPSLPPEREWGGEPTAASSSAPAGGRSVSAQGLSEGTSPPSRPTRRQTDIGEEPTAKAPTAKERAGKAPAARPKRSRQPAKEPKRRRATDRTAEASPAVVDDAGVTPTTWWGTLKVRWRIVALFTAIGAVLGAGYTATQPTLYASEGSVVVSPAAGFLDPEVSNSITDVTGTFSRLVETPRVLASSAARLEEQGRETPSVDELADRVSAEQIGTSSLIRITTQGDDQAEASALNSAVIDSLVRLVSDETQTATAGAGIKLEVFSQSESVGRVSPTEVRNILTGANAGLLLGIALALTPIGAGLSRHFPLRVRQRREP